MTHNPADVMEEFHDPRVSATNVLIAMVQVRTRDCLDMVLAAVMQCVNFYERAPEGEKNHIHKDAVLRMIGSLRSLLLKNNDYHVPIENLLIQHVFPEFQSPTGFLRSRACWTIGMFNKLPFSNAQARVQSVSLVVGALQDNELPVKLEAARAFSRLIKDPSLVEHIKPMVPVLLDQYFHLVDEVGNEEVVSTLALMIEHIGPDIAPYAVQVVERLTRLFLVLSQADEEDDEAALTAVECIRAVSTILYSLETLPDIYPVLEEICQPFISHLMKPESMEFLDDALEIITCFTYYPKQISPFMWTVLGMLVEGFHSHAVDYIRDMLPAIDNFISRGADFFVQSQNPSYLQLVLSMVTKAYADDNLKTEAKHTNKIMEAILAHCRGRVDHVIPGIVELCGNKLFVEEDLQFKLLICDVLGGAAYYNPSLFIQIIANFGPDFETKLFNYWLSHLDAMTGASKAKHMKMSTLGLASLALLPLQQLPALLQNAFPELLVQVVKLLGNLKQSDDAESDEDEGEDYSDYEDDGEVLDVDEDEDNEAELENAADFTRSIQENLQSLLDGDVDAEMYSSPLDDVDPFVFFAQCLEAMAGANGQFYQNWNNGLPGEVKECLAMIMSEATQRKLKADEKKSNQ